MQIGANYDFTVPSTYSYGGIWRVLVGSNNRSHTVTADNNEILVVYTTQMSTADIIVNYVDYENPLVILRSTNVGKRAVGTEYESTAPDSIDVNGEWLLVGNGIISHLVTDLSNTITVYYEKNISNADVIIKYVEAGDNNNVLTSINMGLMQVGSTYSFSVSSTFEHGGIWNLVGSTSRTYIITENSNEILIEYIPPANLVVPVTIKYVDKDDYNNVFETIINNNVPVTKFDEYDTPIDDVYIYDVDATVNSNGLWSVIGNNIGRTYNVKHSNNVIIVEYEKVMVSDIVIQYIDDYDNTLLEEIPDQNEYQVGTNYNHVAPDMINDNGRWILIGSANINHNISQNGNTIKIYYEKMMSEDNVVIRYVEKDNHSNILKTINAGFQQVDSIYLYTPEDPITSNGEWSLYGISGQRSYKVLTDLNIIYVEYVPTMSGTITINYVDSTNSNVILYTTTVPARQVGTTYNFNVPSTHTDSLGVWTLVGSTSRSEVITSGNNVINVPYLKPIIYAPVVVKYMSDDLVPILLNTAFEGTREVGSTYNHSAPLNYNSNGLWQRVGIENRSLVVQNGINEMVVTYTRVLSTDEVTIQFVDTDTMSVYPSNVLTSSNAGYKQVGSIYTYYPPNTYIDGDGRGWQLVTASPINYTVLQNNNYVVVQYRLVSRPLSYDEVTIKYVEQGSSPANVLKTTVVGQIEIDTIYQFDADSSFTNSLRNMEYSWKYS